jgi:hypothetical protein
MAAKNRLAGYDATRTPEPCGRGKRKKGPEYGVERALAETQPEPVLTGRTNQDLE